ncbi:hypothetical protein [Legionella impletisoli]|uniref:Aminoglycoside phosphotransferase domain-containing protein n=1 Tax=Legionella impletisoli TaxID=343510 RepID=A0A917JN36_9GAMM|nr:hypothetical protein [Legionella impletisoli]GGI77382.1 hypothetical protein GCM10007966_02670 [Legionella impletisoli]
MNLNRQKNPWEALKEKFDFLREPSSYHEHCSEVTYIETHMSFIFLTNQHAYKLKKPVTFSYLDFSTLESRRNNCFKEVEINQFLAANIYLKPIPLMLNKQKKLIPVGHPEGKFIVDWLVKMKRFPREKTLDEAILNQKINWTLVKEAANLLMHFYSISPPTQLSPERYLLNLKESIFKNEQALINPSYSLNTTLVKELHSFQQNELHALSDEIKHRVLQGKVLECHGDLRPEHVCLISPPIITDRLEFNRTLRVMDVVEELAYFSLECEFLGNSEVGTLFLSTYQEHIEDIPSPRLWRFYTLLRTCLRAKISAWHLDDPQVNDLEKWYKKAQDYLTYATSKV